MTKRIRATPLLQECDLAAAAEDGTVGNNLHELLHRVDVGSRTLQYELEELEREHGASIYSELIYHLSHVRIDDEEAKGHWGHISEHRRSMEEHLGSTVDPRVALLDYFVSVNRRLKNPKIIEMRLFDETRACAYRDELTGLYNYRFFGEHLAREIARRDRNNAPLSLAMIDVDDFKFYNDRNGHDAGNQVLGTVARLLTESLRQEDVAVRYGGEEFALILPSTPKTGARKLAERVRYEISRHPFPSEESQPGGRLTVSIGIATLPADAKDAEEVLRRADRAMYRAKAAGKNQVYLFGQSCRSHRRVEASLEGSYRLFADELHTLTTVTISDGGLLFVSDRPIPHGASIQLSLKLRDSDTVTPIVGRVIYTEKTGNGEFKAAVSLADSTASNRKILARYISESAPV